MGDRESKLARPASIVPATRGVITEADIDDFDSDDWRPEAGRLSPLVVALWRGAKQSLYVIQNAGVVSPAALDYFAASGEYIRHTWSHGFTPIDDDAAALEDLATELERALTFIRAKLVYSR